MKNIFKKLVSFALVLCFGVSLVACGSDNSLSQKETEEYTAKVVESIDLVNGYTFSGAYKATSKTKAGQEVDEGTHEVEVSGYVYSNGNRLVDLTLLATVVDQAYDYEYDEDTEDYKKVDVYEYTQLYFNNGVVYIREAKSAQKNKEVLEDVTWEIKLAIPVYELPEESEVILDENVENDDLDEEPVEEPEMSLNALMGLAMELVADLANQEFDAKEAITFVVGALGNKVQGKLENGEVSLYVTHNYANAVNSILSILVRDAKSQTATLATTINDVMAVVKDEFGLTYEGKFTDLLLANIEKVLYKEVVDETTEELVKVSNTVEDIVALLDKFFEDNGADVSVEALVNMLPEELLGTLGLEVAENETVYSTLMTAFGKITLEDLFYQYVEPMIVSSMSDMMGGENNDVATYDLENGGEQDDETVEEPTHMIDYMEIADYLKLGLQMPSSMVLSSLVANLVNEKGDVAVKFNKISYYVAVVATKEGEFAGFDIKLEFAGAYGSANSMEASITVNLRVEKVVDKAELDDVDVSNALTPEKY